MPTRVNCRRAIHHHLGGTVREAAVFDVPQSRHARRSNATEGGWAVVGTQRGAVLADDSRERLNVTSGVLHAGDGENRIEGFDWSAGTLFAAEGNFDEVRRANVGIDVTEHIGEQAVEGARKRVGEDEGARQEPGAKDDGERSEDEATLAGERHLE